MADRAAEQQVQNDLALGAEAIARLSENEETFEALVAAFRKQDRDAFGDLIERHGLAGRCEHVCRWLRSKECVLLCIELCGPPVFELDELPSVREFAEVVGRLTAEDELLELAVRAVEERDRDAWRELVEKLEIERYCHLLGHWICTLHCRRVCELLCLPIPLGPRHLAAEMRAAGEALSLLARSEGRLEKAAEAAAVRDCGLLRGIFTEAGVGEWGYLLCEWLCIRRCMLVCLRLCRPFPFEEFESPVEEMRDFARACGRLAGEPGVFERLSAAVAEENSELFAELLRERELERFCLQLCHWVHWLRCHRFCICVFPPPEAVAHWTQVEIFDIHPPAGSPGAMFTADGYAGLPASIETDAFVFGELPGRGGVLLNGNCPLTDIASGNPLEYRFSIGEWTWPSGHADDPALMPAVAPAALSPVTELEQTLVGHVYYADPLSPAPVYIDAKDVKAEGWIEVNGKAVTVPISVGSGTMVVTVTPGNFLRTDALILMNSAQITAAHPAKLPGGLAQAEAGRSLTAGEQEPIRRYRLRFEARDTVTHATVCTDTLSAIILNNSSATVALDLEELLSNLCKPLAGQTHAHLLYTVDHPHLRSFSVAIGNNGGQVHPPPAFSGSPVVAMPDGQFTAGSFFFRGGAGGPHNASGTGGVAVDISKDPPCAYRVSLSWATRRYGDSGHSEQILYCK